MASWVTNAYYNDGVNEQFYIISTTVNDGELYGVNNTTTVYYQGFVIDISWYLGSGENYAYQIFNYNIHLINSQNTWNRYILTLNNQDSTYVSLEKQIHLNQDEQIVTNYSARSEFQSTATFVFYNMYQTNVYGEAYNRGEEDGEAYGYQRGLQDGQSGSSTFSGTFSLIGSAFNSLGGLMEVQVIGGLSIGALIGIPLSITILITVFKILRK